MPDVELIAARELPDARPAFAAGAARADADGNVWVRLTPTTQDAAPVYDVIDARGTLVDRVVLPANATIAGFGPGVVYLALLRDGAFRLARASVR